MALAILSAVVGIVVRNALQVWGILDPFSEWLGRWLEVHIAPEQAEWTTAAIIAVSGYGIALWFVWRQFRAPLLDKGEGQALARSIRNVAEPETKPMPEPQDPVPDMPIHDLFFHIRPDLLEKVDEKRWEGVARDVMDKFSTAQLDVWGREIDPSLNIAGALAKIPPNYWRNRTFIFHFLYEDKGVGKLVGKEMAHTYSWQDPKALQYADLQVNRMQAFRIWPRPIEEPLPNHWKDSQSEPMLWDRLRIYSWFYFFLVAILLFILSEFLAAPNTPIATAFWGTLFATVIIGAGLAPSHLHRSIVESFWPFVVTLGNYYLLMRYFPEIGRFRIVLIGCISSIIWGLSG